MKKQKVIRIDDPVAQPLPDLQDPGQGRAWRNKHTGVVYFGNVYLGTLDSPEDFEMIAIE